MKLYVAKGCQESLIALVGFRASSHKGIFEVLSSDSKPTTFLKSTKQIPCLQTDSGNFLFTLESILFYLVSPTSKQHIDIFIKDLSLEEVNSLLPRQLLFGKNETVDPLDMAVFLKTFQKIEALRSTKSLYSVYPKVGLWSDKVTSSKEFHTAKQELEITEKKVPPKLPQRQKSSDAKAPKSTQCKQPASENTVENFLQVKVSNEDKAAGVAKWRTGYPEITAISSAYPIKPLPGRKNNLITSALPYVNNVPHLGNIIGAVLSADCFARYCRLKNENTLYICGTDEYGTATETKALAEGLTPQQICDKYHVLHSDVYRWFNISFDYFGRTTTKQQTEIAQNIFWKVHNNGFTVAETVEQLFCGKCSKFLADRFVEGICPFCGYEDARGDQCDKCSKLINPTELKEPRCKVCGSAPQIKTSQHLFLDLPQFEDALKTFTNARTDSKAYNNTTSSITYSWLKSGLKPRCITRDLKWGTPVPHPDYEGKVFYVWFDAPIGYVSITANYMKEWELWWKNPDNVTLHQFMAKDNVPFHSVIFPASLMATKENYTLVKNLDGIDYLQYEGMKFSKSRGVGVFGDQAAETGIPSDIYRCYLLLNRPETSDTNFTWEGLAQTNNNILLNNFGNFVLRALTFCKNTFKSEIPEITLNDDDKHFIALVNQHLAAYTRLFDNRVMGRAFEYVFLISKIGNQYLQYNTPWVLAKGSAQDKARAGSVIGVAVNVVALLSVAVSPYMPTVSSVLQEQLNIPNQKKFLTEMFVPIFKTGHVIGQPFPLFSKIEDSRVKELQNQYSGVQSSPQQVSVPVDKLQDQIAAQGIKVRELKAGKADPATIQQEVKVLLDLKNKLPPGLQASDNKKPKTKAQPKPQPKLQGTPAKKIEITAEITDLLEKITIQGNKVREVKANGSDKSIIDEEVKRLLALKTKLPPELQSQPNKKGKKNK